MRNDRFQKYWVVLKVKKKKKKLSMENLCRLIAQREFWSCLYALNLILISGYILK